MSAGPERSCRRVSQAFLVEAYSEPFRSERQAGKPDLRERTTPYGI